MLKRLQFNNSEGDKTAQRVEQCRRLDERDNKEGYSLDKYKGEIESARYVLSPFIALPPLSKKESNRPSDLGKRTKSLNPLVCISKICYSEKC